MTKAQILKQCLLKRGNPLMETVAWIPATFAVVGRVVDLKSRLLDHDKWSHGWHVVQVYKTVLSHFDVREHQKSAFPSLR